MSKQRNVVSQADRAALEEHYEFIPSTTRRRDDGLEPSSWQDRMSQRYMDGLYKEYALADLSRPGQLGLRWRTQHEVMAGKGERSCGNKRCSATGKLATLEVPFSYREKGLAKKELVKLRLCAECRPQVQNSSESNPSRGTKPVRHSSDDNDSSSDSSYSSSPSESSHRKRKRKGKRKEKSRKEKKRRKRESEK